MQKLGTRRQQDRRDGGFSLVEALVASALVLMITIGVMPLFTYAVVQNVSGRESTISTNYSRSSTEELIALPLDRESLRPPTGLLLNELCQEYDPDTGWEGVICSAPETPGPIWRRTTEVRQYNISEIYDSDTVDGNPTFKTPIVGYDLTNTSQDPFVHIRELAVITEGKRADNSPLGKARRMDTISLRGF